MKKITHSQKYTVLTIKVATIIFYLTHHLYYITVATCWYSANDDKQGSKFGKELKKCGRFLSFETFVKTFKVLSFICFFLLPEEGENKSLKILKTQQLCMLFLFLLFLAIGAVMSLVLM